MQKLSSNTTFVRKSTKRFALSFQQTRSLRHPCCTLGIPRSYVQGLLQCFQLVAPPRVQDLTRLKCQTRQLHLRTAACMMHGRRCSLPERSAQPCTSVMHKNSWPHMLVSSLTDRRRRRRLHRLGQHLRALSSCRTSWARTQRQISGLLQAGLLLQSLCIPSAGSLQAHQARK